MTNKQEAARQARIASERRRLRPKPWQFCPSQVFGKSCPYTVDVIGYRSWIEAQAMAAEILEVEPDYFTRPPKG